MHWRRKWQPTPVFLPGESQGWQSLMGCCLWGCKESDTASDLAAAAGSRTQGLRKLLRVFQIVYLVTFIDGLPRWLGGKESACNAGDALGRTDPLEKEIATTAVVLPGKSHRQRSLAGYSSWSGKRVRYDLATEQAHTHNYR